MWIPKNTHKMITQTQKKKHNYHINIIIKHMEETNNISLSHYNHTDTLKTQTMNNWEFIFLFFGLLLFGIFCCRDNEKKMKHSIEITIQSAKDRIDLRQSYQQRR